MLNFEARKHDTLEYLRLTARNRGRNPDTPPRRTANNPTQRVRFCVGSDQIGHLVQPYDYAAYGEPRVYAGEDSAFGCEVGRLLTVSSVGNPYMHQVLRRDDETALHENRFRAYHARPGRTGRAGVMLAVSERT